MSKKGLAQAARALQHVLAAPTSPTGMPSPEEDLPIREAGDDHFYGPWRGGSKGAGGRPETPLGEKAWQEPPPKEGVAGQGKAGGYSSDDAYGTNTVLGRAGERSFVDVVGGEILHAPGKGEQSPLDVKVGEYGFEVKAVSTRATKYAATPKGYEIAQKEAYAKKLGLKPALAIVVMDSKAGKAHVYWREGLRGGRLSRATGWKYLGSGTAAQIAEAFIAAFAEAGDDHFYGPWTGGPKSQGGGPVQSGAGGQGRMELTAAEREEVVTYKGIPQIGITDDPDYVGEGYGLKRGADERLEQTKAMTNTTHGIWETDYAHGSKTRAMEQMEWHWADSAASPASSLMQSSAAEAGLGGGMVWSRGYPLLQPSDASRAATREMYDRTQAKLASGPETYTLYRGIKSQKSGALSGNVLESWSTEPGLAARFDGGGVLQMTVPRSAIFMDLRHVSSQEKEMVVLGGRIDRGKMVHRDSEWARGQYTKAGYQGGFDNPVGNV